MILLLNMGVPMIMPTLYFMVAALVPIVLIEAYYTSKKLRIRFRKSVGSVAWGSVVSTVVGIPLTWVLLFAIQVATGVGAGSGFQDFGAKVLRVTLHAAWLPPSSPEEFWIFHAAALFLLIPFFFVTWMIEYVIARNNLASEIVEVRETIELPAAEKMVLTAVRNSNLITYGLIALLLVISLGLSVISRI